MMRQEMKLGLERPTDRRNTSASDTKVGRWVGTHEMSDGGTTTGKPAGREARRRPCRRRRPEPERSQAAKQAGDAGPGRHTYAKTPGRHPARQLFNLRDVYGRYMRQPKDGVEPLGSGIKGRILERHPGAPCLCKETPGVREKKITILRHALHCGRANEAGLSGVFRLPGQEPNSFPRRG